MVSREVVAHPEAEDVLRRRSLLLLSVLILLLGLILGWSLSRSGSENDPRASTEPSTEPTTEPTSEPTTSPGAPPRAEALAAPPGPSGLNWPDHTPAYDTPATKKIDKLSELNQALADATAGDVIEVAPQTWSGGDLVVSKGDDGWARNVLVRPPLGQRQSVVVVVDDRALVLDAPHVTVAGFQAREINIAERGDRSAFARIVMTDNSFIKASARGDVGDDHVLEDAGFYEIVAPEVRTDVGEDRMNISTYGTGEGGEVGEVVGLTVAGLWLEGSYRAHGSDAHTDTLQTFGAAGSPPPRDLTVLNSVLFASTNAAWQAGDGGVVGTWTIRNSLMVNCQNDDAGKVPDGYDCGGTNTFNTALDVDPDAKVVIRDTRMYGNVRHPELPFVLQDVCADNLAGGAESGPVEDKGGNTLGEQAVAAKCAHVDPKLPDLDAIWE